MTDRSRTSPQSFSKIGSQNCKVRGCLQVKFFPVQFCSGSEFLRAVAKSKDETFVKSLVVRSILQHQWEAYGRRVLQAQLTLYVLTFAMLEVLGAGHFIVQGLLAMLLAVLLVTELYQVREVWRRQSLASS